MKQPSMPGRAYVRQSDVPGLPTLDTNGRSVSTSKKPKGTMWGVLRQRMEAKEAEEMDVDNTAPQQEGASLAYRMVKANKPRGLEHTISEGEEGSAQEAEEDAEDRDFDIVDAQSPVTAEHSRPQPSGIGGLGGRRRSILGVLQSCKVLRGVPTRLQVWFARQQLQRQTYTAAAGNSGQSREDILTAGSAAPEQNLMMIVETGVLEVLVPGRGGEEVLIASAGPGSLLGGERALGLVSCQLMTVRLARKRLDIDAETLNEELDNRKEPEARVLIITGAELAGLEDKFRGELDHLKRRVLKDMRMKIMPRLTKVMAQGGFFRRYHIDFVRRLARDLDLRIFKPGELIFKEKSRARSLAILFSGSIDVFMQGKRVAQYSGCGFEFGESALLDEGTLRAATVRCSEQSECLICLLHADVFSAAFEEFPEERDRLEEQVRTRLTQLTLKDVDAFARCDLPFLHLLSTISQVVSLPWGVCACEPGEGEEVLHVVYLGRAVVERVGSTETPEVLTKGKVIGLEAALGLRKGPPEYRLVVARSGCAFIRISYAALDKALLYFPGQLQVLLAAAGVSEVPEAHPFRGKEDILWARLHLIFCKAFATLQVSVDQVRALTSVMQPEIFESGVTITEENQKCKGMIMLLDGTVTWSQKGIVTTAAEAPRHFDEGVIMGLQHTHVATIIATSTCVVWHFFLPAFAQQPRRGVLFRRRNVVKEAAAEPSFEEAWKCIRTASEERCSLHENLQDRLRNMKTFSRFRPEILTLIATHLDIRTFLPHQDIFASGDEAEYVYMLLKGRAEAYSGGKANLLNEGATFGEMVLFGQHMRSTTVRAATLCVCNAVHRDLVSYAFSLYPQDRGTAVKRHGSKLRPRLSAARSSKAKMVGPEAANKNSSNPLSATVVRTAATEERGMRRERRESKLVLANKDKVQQRTRAEPPADTASVTSQGSDGVGGGRGSVSCGGLMVELGDFAGRGLEEQRAMGVAQGGGFSGHSSPLDDDLLGTGEARRPQLWERFQNRSCLFDVPTPAMPPAEAELYIVSREAEERLMQSFSGVMPRSAVRSNACRHGVRTGSDKGSAAASLMQSTTSVERCAHRAGDRPLRVWPTYTSPLPPLSSRPLQEQLEPPVPRCKEAEQSLAIAGHLQAYASSLLRISGKPESAAVMLGKEVLFALPSSPPRGGSASELTRRRKVATLRRRYMPPPLALLPPASRRPASSASAKRPASQGFVLPPADAAHHQAVPPEGALAAGPLLPPPEEGVAVEGEEELELAGDLVGIEGADDGWSTAGSLTTLEGGWQSTSHREDANKRLTIMLLAHAGVSLNELQDFTVLDSLEEEGEEDEAEERSEEEIATLLAASAAYVATLTMRVVTSMSSASVADQEGQDTGQDRLQAPNAKQEQEEDEMRRHATKAFHHQIQDEELQRAAEAAMARQQEDEERRRAEDLQREREEEEAARARQQEDEKRRRAKDPQHEREEEEAKRQREEEEEKLRRADESQRRLKEEEARRQAEAVRAKQLLNDAEDRQKLAHAEQKLKDEESHRQTEATVQGSYTARVSVISAAGLRSADVVGKSDPYCICQIPGKPATKFRTKTMQGTLDPVWNHEVVLLAGYTAGDDIKFDVFDEDWPQFANKDDVLGTATLTSAQFLPNGFDGKLELSNAGKGVHASLRVKVEVELHKARTTAGSQVLETDPLIAANLCLRRSLFAAAVRAA